MESYVERAPRQRDKHVLFDQIGFSIQGLVLEEGGVSSQQRTSIRPSSDVDSVHDPPRAGAHTCKTDPPIRARIGLKPSGSVVRKLY